MLIDFLPLSSFWITETWYIINKNQKNKNRLLILTSEFTCTAPNVCVRKYNPHLKQKSVGADKYLIEINF